MMGASKAPRVRGFGFSAWIRLVLGAAVVAVVLDESVGTTFCVGWVSLTSQKTKKQKANWPRDYGCLNGKKIDVF
jgi:hypothetical protein